MGRRLGRIRRREQRLPLPEWFTGGCLGTVASKVYFALLLDSFAHDLY